MPSARPRSAGGVTEVRMAMPVAKTMAMPKPWTTRNKIRASTLPASPHRTEVAVKTIIPTRNTRLRP